MARTREEILEYKREYNRKNKDIINRKNEIYRMENREKVREIGRRNYADNRKRKLEIVHVYRAKNIDKIRKYDKARKVTSWAKMLFRRTKSRSHSCGFENNLSAQLIKDLFSKQKGKCYWFGVDMKITMQPKYPLQVSVDRLDNDKGYTIDNVVLCTYMANMGRNSNTVEVFRESIQEIKKSLLA